MKKLQVICNIWHGSDVLGECGLGIFEMCGMPDDWDGSGDYLFYWPDDIGPEDCGINGQKLTI